MTEFQIAEPLPADRLLVIEDAAAFDFETTQDLPPVDGWPGQDRAMESLVMAAESRHAGFNAFVLGTRGTGRHSAAREVLRQAARERDVPSDWVYVNRFDDARRPQALSLPPGLAVTLRSSVEKLIDDLANDIPAIFESDDYQTRRRAIDETYGERHEAAMSALADKARGRGVAILRTPMGFGVAARKGDEILPPDEYEALPENERAHIDAAVAEIRGELETILKSVPREMKAQRHEIETLNATLAEEAVDAASTSVRARFAQFDKVASFLADLRRDLIENVELFLMREDEAKAGGFPVATTRHFAKPQFQRYAVNVVVDHAQVGAAGAPVIEETLPSLANLIGRIEHATQNGALVTNFTMIRPGALHRANGGFLILDARQVLSEPLAWEALKRCLRTREIQIYSPGERMSLVSTATLDPDPIPLDLRVVMIGDRRLYYLLAALDPEFTEFFKLEADFADRVARSDDAVQAFARLVGTVARDRDLRPLDAGGTARMLAEATRMADDAERLTLNIDALSDLVLEADHWADRAGVAAIRAADIDAAIAAGERRTGRIRELSHEAITRGTMLIDTDGARVGQINGLSVLQIGRTRFGKPTRITVRTRMGAGKFVDIERETKLGGPLHSKGVMVLSGYLSGTYAQDLPLSLWASIVFEQSYGGVDGDSASSAELYAVLSSLSGLPIDQSLAVTGSVNQFGDVQAIGGVNEKIEGFFDICAERGLTGQQGVLIPAANVKHLALRGRVVDAVRAGKFQVIPVATIDQGIALLTGTPAGARGENGRFPEQTVNALVEARLGEFAKARRRFGGRRGPNGQDNT